MTNRPHRRPSRHGDRPPLPPDPVTVGSAESAGWTRSAQRHAIDTGDLQRLRRGVLGRVLAPCPELPWRAMAEAENLRNAQAAALTCPRAAISHVSAAIAHSMPTLGDVGRPCLTVPAGTALRELVRVHLHRATLLDDEVTVVDGYRVLAPARTVMDVARERGVEAGVVTADYALRERLVDANSLGAAFERCAGWPGRKAARITLLLADGAAESPLESVSRVKMAAAGLPRPRLQPDICDEFGRFLGRCDFYWDEFGVVGEADGDLKYDGGRPAIVKERGRQKYFEDTGLLVVRWGWADLYAFDAVARRLRTAYRRGAGRGSADRRWGILPPRSGLHP